MNSYVRFKLTPTEDDPTIRPHLEDRWAELPEARTAPIELSLALLESLHQRWTLVLRAIHPEQWKCTFRHPEIGPTTLERNLALLRVARTSPRGPGHSVAGEDGVVGTVSSFASVRQVYETWNLTSGAREAGTGTLKLHTGIFSFHTV
jgi:hypothetical protein